MGEEEAVALLMDLANVEEASYLKDNPGSAWPPQAAFAISAECGLLPITLLIAAQVIRSWGSGYVGRLIDSIHARCIAAHMTCCRANDKQMGNGRAAAAARGARLGHIDGRGARNRCRAAGAREE